MFAEQKGWISRLGEYMKQMLNISIFCKITMNWDCLIKCTSKLFKLTMISVRVCFKHQGHSLSNFYTIGNRDISSLKKFNYYIFERKNHESNTIKHGNKWNKKPMALKTINRKTMICHTFWTAQTLDMYLLKCLTNYTREDLTGNTCNFANINFETSKLPDTLTVSTRRKVLAILSKQGILRTYFLLLEHSLILLRKKTAHPPSLQL